MKTFVLQLPLGYDFTLLAFHYTIYCTSKNKNIPFDLGVLLKYACPYIRCHTDKRGNSVKIGNGPAAVTGDKILQMPLKVIGKAQGRG